jgi:hypothetical protein
VAIINPYSVRTYRLNFFHLNSYTENTRKGCQIQSLFFSTTCTYIYKINISVDNHGLIVSRKIYNVSIYLSPVGFQNNNEECRSLRQKAILQYNFAMVLNKEDKIVFSS